MPNDAIIAAQKRWNTANANGDTGGMAQAHTDAENARAQLGYSGGSDGTGYFGVTAQPKNNYAGQMQSAMQSYKNSMNKSLPVKSSSDYIVNMNNALNGMYDNQVNSALTRLKLAREQKAQGINSQQGVVNNQYQDALDNLNQSKAQTQQRYANTRQDSQNELAKALGEMNQTMEQTLPQYQQQRNAQTLQAAKAAQVLKEMLANQGSLNSGQNITGNLGIQSNLANNIQGINTNQQNFLNDLSRQRTNLNNDMAIKLEQLGADENLALNDLTNQLSSIDREKAQKISDLNDQLRLLEAQGADEDNAIVQELMAKRDQMMVDVLNNADNRDFQIAQLQNQRTNDLYNGLMSRYNQLSNNDLQNLQLAEQQRMNNFNVYNTNRNYDEGVRQWNQDFGEKQKMNDYNIQDNDRKWDYNVFDTDRKYTSSREDTAWEKQFKTDQFDWQKNMDSQQMALARAKGSGGSSGGGSSMPKYTTTQQKDNATMFRSALSNLPLQQQHELFKADDPQIINAVGGENYVKIKDEVEGNYYVNGPQPQPYNSNYDTKSFLVQGPALQNSKENSGWKWPWQK